MKLKEKAVQTESKEEATKTVEESNTRLSDEEMDTVAGGYISDPKHPDQEIII